MFSHLESQSLYLIFFKFHLAVYFPLSFNTCISPLETSESITKFCTLPSHTVSLIVYLLVWYLYWGKLKHYLHKYCDSCCDKKSNRYNYTGCISHLELHLSHKHVTCEGEGKMTFFRCTCKNLRPLLLLNLLRFLMATLHHQHHQTCLQLLLLW